MITGSWKTGTEVVQILICWLINKINAGLAVRETYVMAANDYYHEPANFTKDINQVSGTSFGVTDNFVFFNNAYNNLAGTASAVPILGEQSRVTYSRSSCLCWW